LVLTVVFVGLLIADRLAPALTAKPAVGLVLGAALSVLAIITIVWVVRTGHLGAQMIWGHDGGGGRPGQGGVPGQGPGATRPPDPHATPGC
jgi:hypothetical protein